MTVELATELTEEICASFVQLMPQLSSSNPAPDREQLSLIIASPSTHLFLSRDENGRICGSLTLAVFRIPTGIRAWVEDVVVDSSARGKGMGEALCRAAIDHAKALGAITVDLTSRPSREAANRLYKRVGFSVRETNVYRFTS
ncbi:MAG: GNAT family N-acetyltransferase [Burkholderiales bacterium]|nr:GNAT family N-acetyltransferase [Burkholderiales bacterium]